ncbi:MAG: hypothetical protein V1717_01690, partial [Candidatus Micrarchaeota archaeon]
LDGSTSQKMGVVVSYGDSYKDSFDAQAQTCAADFAKGKTEILNTSYVDCKKKGVFCPVISLKDASGDGKVKPICIPASATKNGLLSSDESTDEDVPEDYQTAFAKFSDKGNSNAADDVWYCESARIVAVADFCYMENCNTYCTASGVEGFEERCDFADATCDPSGKTLVESSTAQTENLNQGPLFEVPFDQFPNTPADAPFSMFPKEYERGFTYNLPVNTIVTFSEQGFTGGLNDVRALGFPIASSADCNVGTYASFGLFDLTSKIISDGSSLKWGALHMNALELAPEFYQTVQCIKALPEPVKLCHLIFIDKRGNDDACIKSITQFEYFADEPPSVSYKDTPIAGVSLSQMYFTGRYGQFQGTKKFAITPTGYVIALRSGGKYYQVFDWWKPDGSYGGNGMLTWKKRNWLSIILGIVLLIVGIAFTFGAFGGTAGALGNIYQSCGKFLGAIPGVGPMLGLGAAAAPPFSPAISYAGPFLDAATPPAPAAPPAFSLGSALAGAGMIYSGFSLTRDALSSSRGGCKELTGSFPSSEAGAKIHGCRGEMWKVLETSGSSQN